MHVLHAWIHALHVYHNFRHFHHSKHIHRLLWHFHVDMTTIILLAAKGKCREYKISCRPTHTRGKVLRRDIHGACVIVESTVFVQLLRLRSLYAAQRGIMSWLYGQFMPSLLQVMVVGKVCKNSPGVEHLAVLCETVKARPTLTKESVW